MVAILPSFDEHAVAPAPPPASPSQVTSASITPQRIRVDGNVQAANLIRKMDPVCPALASQARISGKVTLTLTIAKDGSTQNIQVVSGHPLLVPAAIEAVRQWAYKPTFVNGNPVEVITSLDLPMDCR